MVHEKNGLINLPRKFIKRNNSKWICNGYEKASKSNPTSKQIRKLNATRIVVKAVTKKLFHENLLFVSHALLVFPGSWEENVHRNVLKILIYCIQ